jgi:hypothetical protein
MSKLETIKYSVLVHHHATLWSRNIKTEVYCNADKQNALNEYNKLIKAFPNSRYSIIELKTSEQTIVDSIKTDK